MQPKLETVQRQETAMSQQMQAVQNMALSLHQDDLVSRTVIEQMNAYVRRKIEMSNGRFAKKISMGENHVLHEEATRLIVNHLIELCSDQFKRIINTNYPVQKHTREIATTLDIHEGIIIDILNGNTPLKDIVHDTKTRHELEEKLLIAMEDERLQRHYMAMLHAEEAVFRPLKYEDVEDVADLYREFQHNGESLVRLANGEPVKQTFLKGPEAHEIPDMHRLLKQTEELNKKKGINKRREKETMKGVVLCSKLDPREILAVYIETDAPMDPALDQEYLKENEHLLEHGVTGGKMKYADEDIRGWSPDKEKFRELWLGKGGRSKKIFLIASKVPGLAPYTQAKGILQPRNLVPGTVVTTYTLKKTHVFVNGVGIGGKTRGRNKNLIRMEEKAGMEVTDASDRNEESELEEFDVKSGEQALRIGALPEWIYLIGDHDEMAQKAQTQMDI